MPIGHGSKTWCHGNRRNFSNHLSKKSNLQLQELPWISTSVFKFNWISFLKLCCAGSFYRTSLHCPAVAAMNQLRPEDRMQRMQPCDVVSGTLGFSCFLVSFPLRFSSFSCPDFGTSHSHPNHLQVLPPIPAWPLVTRHFCTNKLPFTSHKPVTPPHRSLDFAKATCFSASTSSTAWSRFPEPSQTWGNFNVKHRSIALFCSSLFLTISSKSPENNGKHHDQK